MRYAGKEEQTTLPSLLSNLLGHQTPHSILTGSKIASREELSAAVKIKCHCKSYYLTSAGDRYIFIF